MDVGKDLLGQRVEEVFVFLGKMPQHMNRRRTIFTLLCSLTVVVGLPMTVQAGLIDRGLFDADGVPGGPTVRLIYDNDLDITWLGDANFGAGTAFDDGHTSTDGRMTWQNAVDWAASLTVGGFTDWHLPVTVFPDSGCASGTSQTQKKALGVTCTLSDMGHLYYDELGNSVDDPLLNDGPFKHYQKFKYWSETRYTFAPNGAYNFNFGRGWQDANGLVGQFNAWAVRDGDVGPIPVYSNDFEIAVGPEWSASNPPNSLIPSP